MFEVFDCDGLFWGTFEMLSEAVRHANGVGHGASVVRRSEGRPDALVMVIEGNEERKKRERWERWERWAA